MGLRQSWARNLSITSVLERFQFLLRDRDTKFTTTFDTVLASDGVYETLTPVRAPVANAYAARFVQTIRRERLDWILIRGEHHLHCVERRDRLGGLIHHYYQRSAA